MSAHVRARPPTMPTADPDDRVENAVVSRLTTTWGRRATVKKPEPDLDDLFDLEKHDYPDTLLPFARHDAFLSASEDARNRLRAWAWVAFNKNVMDIEQYVVNPGFDLLAHDAFDSGLGDTLYLAVHQSMVDEQYHTLMHRNASAVTRRRRGWALPDRVLPDVLTVRRVRRAADEAGDRRVAALLTLAFTTVAEISISSYLDLVCDDEDVQPVNRATVRLHNRDEYTHASITSEAAAAVFDGLDGNECRVFLEGLVAGMDAFGGNDFGSWRAIVDYEELPGGQAMIDDAEHHLGSARPGQDFSGIRRLCEQLDVAERLSWDWT
ncbi:diiron oxygenase [Rhodococcus triatomae]|uniref:p-aminobenzoate N-oxygenase AurF n=1 Tax=Rhodococcus triatomae TaxID=300028 RepID=A0A1G8JNE8_9NOCA|nr:diiron oxygenase [Rhodococcus triatomae]QNG19673.1 diiron oxygenase [Rhodococcus triatomae]QNG24412.1 diiron oxygenase [Rhodococcus triatomae]SDI32809.1 P-aminobenzoate N-oxygenase AurF [Rhodococcus triatomae]